MSAREPRVVGKCSKLVSTTEGSEECQGQLVENYSDKNKLVGYICRKCGDKQGLTDPIEFAKSLSR